MDSAPEYQEFSCANGQRVGWREYGAATGIPVFFNNGWPSCSAQAVFLHAPAVKLGLRIIAPDRPGFGNSISQPHRGLLDWPPVVAELADHLGINRFALLGVSGGGPYTLASAWALGSRITAVSVCAGAVPMHVPGARRGLLMAYRIMLAINDVTPWMLPWLLKGGCLVGRMPIPLALLKFVLPPLLPTPDVLALRNAHNFALFEPSYRGAMQAGGNALYEDALPYTQPWPFALEEINVPVRMWHGTQDANFHISQARPLADRLPNAIFHERNEGHFSLPFNCIEEILPDLLAASVDPPRKVTSASSVGRPQTDRHL